MHASLGGNLPLSLKKAPLHIHDHQLVRSHHALIKASGSGKDALGVEADRKIAFASDDMTSFVKPAAHLADVLAVLFLGERSEVRR
jgi:hypothetical protein